MTGVVAPEASRLLALVARKAADFCSSSAQLLAECGPPWASRRRRQGRNLQGGSGLPTSPASLPPCCIMALAGAGGRGEGRKHDKRGQGLSSDALDDDDDQKPPKSAELLLLAGQLLGRIPFSFRSLWASASNCNLVWIKRRDYKVIGLLQRLQNKRQPK